MLINREGSFRGRPSDWGVSESSGGFKQFVMRLDAEEYWDEENQEWISYAEYDQEITGYFVLYAAQRKPTLNVERVMVATGWDGKSFCELDELGLGDAKIQFRVEERSYTNKAGKDISSLQIVWIDESEAVPGRSIKKASKAELKAWDMEFAAELRANTTQKPATAAKPKTGPPKLAAEPPKRKGRGKAKPKANPVDDAINSMTEDEVWNYVSTSSMRGETETDEKLSEIWLAKIEEIAPGKDTSDLTGEEWYQVREEVVGEFIPF